MRKLVAVFLFPLWVLMSMSFAQAQEQLGGTYLGLDGADGITIRLSPQGNGYGGEILAGSGGGRAELNVQQYQGGARGPLTLQGRQGTVDLTPNPLGLSMVWRPDGGGSDELIYAFRRDQVQLPKPPAGYVDPPPPGADRVNPMDFLNSYEFWEPAQVARAYDGLDDKYRVIVKTFSAVHADILWKLCLSPNAPNQLADALRGQGVTCASVDSRIKASQQTGGFWRFKQQVHTQKIDAVLAVECARGINRASVCTRAAQRTQQAALSLETVGSVLQQY